MEPTAKEIAFALFDEGKVPSDKDVKALKLKAKTRYNYYQLWKNKQGPGSPADLETGDETGAEPGSEVDNSGKGKERTLKTATTPKKGGTAGGAIAVGKITITPENWGMDQHGAILILDTYHKTKKDIGYTGTIGDFLCDICEFYRRVLNYSEVEYARDTRGQGGIGPSEDGGEGARKPLGIAAG